MTVTTPQIGIMQGRLFPPVEGRFQCFPREHWAAEFARAAEAGLASIEWIHDLYGADINPLLTDEGAANLKKLSAQHGVAVRSVCADYFMDKPFLRTSPEDLAERIAHLQRLLRRCLLLGIRHVVLPFVDVSKIETATEEGTVLEVLRRALPTAEETGIELHLETSLPPRPFAALLARIPHPLVKANYDSGNSASLGYRPAEEFETYGERIGSVHIKDRLRGGGTVPLGTGSANFAALRECLGAIDYRRDFVLQVARGEPGAEIEWSRRNRQFVQDWWLPRSAAEPAPS